MVGCRHDGGRWGVDMMEGGKQTWTWTQNWKLDVGDSWAGLPALYLWAVTWVSDSFLLWVCRSIFYLSMLNSLRFFLNTLFFLYDLFFTLHPDFLGILFLSAVSWNFLIITLSWAFLNSLVQFQSELLFLSSMKCFVSLLQEVVLSHLICSFLLKLLSCSTCHSSLLFACPTPTLWILSSSSSWCFVLFLCCFQLLRILSRYSF